MLDLIGSLLGLCILLGVHLLAPHWQADSSKAKNDGYAAQPDTLAPQDEFDQRNSNFDNSQAERKQDNDDLEQSTETSLSHNRGPAPSRADPEACNAAEKKRLRKMKRAEAVRSASRLTSRSARPCSKEREALLKTHNALLKKQEALIKEHEALSKRLEGARNLRGYLERFE